MPKDRRDETKDLHFPKAGIDRSGAFGKQPARPVIGGEYARTTYLGENVRAFDQSGLRLRGGSRAGLSRFMNKRPADSYWITQELAIVTTTGIDPPGGGAMQQSNSGRVVTLVAVSQGTVYVANAGDTAWTTPTNNTGETPALNVTGLVYSAPNNQKLYFVDGINYCYYQPSDNTVNAWTATAGALPVDSDNNTARLIETWRGRTVLSGLLLDPQNIFFSRVSDPTDFDYAPTSPAEDDPVALNLSPLGLIGDVVTGLCAYTDDVMIIFCDHSIFVLRGDPMSGGGQIDRVSDAIGAAWGQAFCKDPYGNVYFYSNQTGIYKMVPGSPPMRISQQIEKILHEIDTGENIIRLAWNDHFQGFHVFVTNVNEPTETDRHFFYESRTGAWWLDSFGNEQHNPLCCVQFDGNLPSDRRLLIGSWDGFVREVNPDALDDDGTDILSEVLIGPINSPTGDEMILHTLTAIMAENSGVVTWEVLTGATAEAALASEPVVDGTWDASRNLTDPVRFSGHAVYIRLSSTVPWAMESITARISAQGMVRRRGT